MLKLSVWFDCGFLIPIFLAGGAGWRSWLPRVLGVEPAGPEPTEPTVPKSAHPEVAQLQKKVGILQQANQQQQEQILYLKELNHRLEEKSREVDEFVHRGALHQHQENQQQTLEGLGRIRRDLEPIIDGIEKSQGSEVTKDLVRKLRGRSQEIEAQIQKMEGDLKKQKEDLLEKLQKKELSLRLKESDLQGVYDINRQLQEGMHRLRLQNSRLAVELKEKEQLLQSFQKAENKGEVYKLHAENSRQAMDEKEKERILKSWQKAENDLKVLKKQFQILASTRERLESAKGLAEENSLLRRTVADLEGKLAVASQQIKLLKLEHEKLGEEFEKLFSQREKKPLY